MQVVKNDDTGKIGSADVTLVGDLREEVPQIFARFCVNVVSCNCAGTRVLSTPKSKNTEIIKKKGKENMYMSEIKLT